MAGDQIKLSVEVTDFMTTRGSVEISGQATQVGGAFADIYKIVDMSEATPGDDPGEWFVTVTADTDPSFCFRKDQPVTVYIRTAKVWVSVLGTAGSPLPTGADPTATADKDTTWNKKGPITQVTGKKRKGAATTC